MTSTGLHASRDWGASRGMGATESPDPRQTRSRRRANTRRLVAHQVRLEQRAFWRNPEYAALTFAMPLVILLVLGATIAGHTQPDSTLQETTLFVPGMLAFGLIVAAYANLASRIAVLRSDGVLKRVAATPLPASAYLVSQLVSTILTAGLIAVATIVAGGAAFRAVPRAGGVLPLLLGLCLGTACLTVLAVAVSAVIPNAETAGPVTLASYLPFALLSGVFSTTLVLPGWLSRGLAVFPVKALVDVLRAGYMPGSFPWASLAVLAGWTVAGLLLARRFFRWQP
jgi:ABC-2 type transport system permease protein